MGLRYQTPEELAYDLERQSKLLTRFYQALHNFAQGLKMQSRGETLHPYFNNLCGSCANLGSYLREHRIKVSQYTECIDEMRLQHSRYAASTGMVANTPFNKFSMSSDYNKSYTFEVQANTVYQNKYRLRWIKDHAQL